MEIHQQFLSFYMNFDAGLNVLDTEGHEMLLRCFEQSKVPHFGKVIHYESFPS